MAERLVGDRLPLAERYAELLATDGVERGLIGPREVDRLWERHLLNCAAGALALPAIEPPGDSPLRVADVGSGAGLPGLVWAIARPDLSVHLVEPMERRCTFLQEVVDELGLNGVTVHRSRAEELTGEARFDVVTARAVAPLDRLARWCLPLLGGHGVLLALKGERAAAEVEESRRVLHRLGARSVAVESYGADLLAVPTRVVRVVVGPRS